MKTITAITGTDHFTMPMKLPYVLRAALMSLAGSMSIRSPVLSIG
jgi:hypothetical protein